MTYDRDDRMFDREGGFKSSFSMSSRSAAKAYTPYGNQSGFDSNSFNSSKQAKPHIYFSAPVSEAYGVSPAPVRGAYNGGYSGAYDGGYNSGYKSGADGYTNDRGVSRGEAYSSAHGDYSREINDERALRKSQSMERLYSGTALAGNKPESKPSVRQAEPAAASANGGALYAGDFSGRGGARHESYVDYVLGRRAPEAPADRTAFKETRESAVRVEASSGAFTVGQKRNKAVEFLYGRSESKPTVERFVDFGGTDVSEEAEACLIAEIKREHEDKAALLNRLNDIQDSTLYNSYNAYASRDNGVVINKNHGRLDEVMGVRGRPSGSAVMRPWIKEQTADNGDQILIPSVERQTVGFAGPNAPDGGRYADGLSLDISADTDYSGRGGRAEKRSIRVKPKDARKKRKAKSGTVLTKLGKIIVAIYLMLVAALAIFIVVQQNENRSAKIDGAGEAKPVEIVQTVTGE